IVKIGSSENSFGTKPDYCRKTGFARIVFHRKSEATRVSSAKISAKRGSDCRSACKFFRIQKNKNGFFFRRGKIQIPFYQKKIYKSRWQTSGHSSRSALFYAGTTQRFGRGRNKGTPFCNCYRC